MDDVPPAVCCPSYARIAHKLRLIYRTDPGAGKYEFTSVLIIYHCGIMRVIGARLEPSGREATSLDVADVIDYVHVHLRVKRRVLRKVFLLLQLVVISSHHN